ALARSAHARHRREHAERELDVDVAQVVLLGADHLDRAARAPALGPGLDLPATGEVLPGEAVFGARELLGRSAEDDLAAEVPRTGTEVDHVIALADRLLVVLDDDDGVAEVAQPLQRGDEPLVVALM